MYKLITAALVVASMPGCATERFGRAMPLTEEERAAYTCEDIELELAKTRSFLNEVNVESSEFKGTDVLAFLGDFGIGNSMERSAATDSGIERVAGLEELRAEKGCVVQQSDVQAQGT